jgi:MFS family permease
VLDIVSRTFYYPTLTNHLMNKYGMSIETTSIFFLIPMFSYFIFLQGIGSTCNILGYKLTLIFGMISISIGVLCLPPISLLPQSVVFVIFGLFVLGIPGALINSPAICDLILILKDKTKLEEAQVNDIASAIYNLALNFGEALGPAYGGYVTQNKNFETSAVYTSIISLFYSIFFFAFYFRDIKYYLQKNVDIHDDKHEPLLKKNILLQVKMEI